MSRLPVVSALKYLYLSTLDAVDHLKDIKDEGITHIMICGEEKEVDEAAEGDEGEEEKKEDKEEEEEEEEEDEDEEAKPIKLVTEEKDVTPPDPSFHFSSYVLLLTCSSRFSQGVTYYWVPFDEDTEDFTAIFNATYEIIKKVQHRCYFQLVS